MFWLSTVLPERIRQDEDLMYVEFAGPVFISFDGACNSERADVNIAVIRL